MKNKKFKYQKNSKEMYQLLKEYGSQEDAIKYAEKLEQLYSNRSYADHNPCTKVHHLVKELNNLTNQQ